MKLAYISTYLPRLCGIATFTKDIVQAISYQGDSSVQQDIFALTDEGETYDYPEEVVFSIAQQQKDDYVKAAKYINTHDYDVCVVEHEFGIFGGNSGVYLLSLIKLVDVPILVNLHTVLENPSADEKAVMLEIAARADKIVVMSKYATDILRRVYAISDEQILCIPHGVPQYHKNQTDAKAALGLTGKKVVLTFGLIGRSKGIDTALKALPQVVAQFPDLLYLVVGKTHPHIIKHSGEEYRESLQKLVVDLGLESNVQFVNSFVETELLTEYLSACDVYITPYVNEAQITSGTLSFAIGAGACVVSTPYWHAKELLANDRGLLFDFNDTKGLGHILIDLFQNPEKLAGYRASAAELGAQLSWQILGGDYLRILKELAVIKITRIADQHNFSLSDMPAYDLTHIKRLSNAVGIMQHATYATPNYHHGYCLDDNARALILLLMSYEKDKQPEDLALISTYLSYIHYTQREDGLFKNFLTYDHRFLDDVGSEDSFGRTIWALGYLFKSAPMTSFYQLGKELFFKSVPHFKNMKSIRAVAYTIIGVTYYLENQPNDESLIAELKGLVEFVLHEYRSNSNADWKWFEKIVSYDNAILPWCLLRASTYLHDDEIKDIAFQSIDFLESVIFEQGFLSIIGNDGWYVEGQPVNKFGQQPIEVTTVVMLFHDAYVSSGEERYIGLMVKAFQWFLGNNELQLSLYDAETKGCCDGLESYGVNRNQGAESTICFWMAYLAVYRALRK